MECIYIDAVNHKVYQRKITNPNKSLTDVNILVGGTVEVIHLGQQHVLLVDEVAVLKDVSYGFSIERLEPPRSRQHDNRVYISGCGVVLRLSNGDFKMPAVKSDELNIAWLQPKEKALGE